MIVHQLIFPCVLQVSIEALFLPSYMYMYMYIQSCLLQEMNDAKKKKKAFKIEVGSHLSWANLVKESSGQKSS